MSHTVTHTHAPPARRRRRRLAAVLVLGALLPLGMLADLAWTGWSHRGAVASLAETAPLPTRYMEIAARTGHPVRAQEWRSLDSIAPIAVCAVLRSEDDRFYFIGTLNYSLQRQMLERVLRGDFSRGSSGIAQQLARNLYLGGQRTPRRKLREYLLAWQITHAVTKDRQLELYLNLVEWGEGIWGIGAASRHYFGVDASELGPTQAVLLSAMLPAPRRGERYPASGGTSGKMAAVTRGLAGAMLIDELTAGATVERITQWRRAVASGLDAREALEAAAEVLGPEPAPHALAGADRQAWPERCDTRRRAG